MKKYFIAQIKKQFHILPCILVVAAILCGGLALLYEGMTSSWSSGTDHTKIRIAAVGTAEDRLLQMGYTALESMDSSRFSLKLLQMEEEAAKDALQTGQISAYVVFPDGFMDSALHGEIMPLHFVSAAGSPDIFTLVKEELTSALSKVLLASEYGAFALGDALRAWGKSELVGQKMNDISLSYVGLLLAREKLYTVEELGITDGIGFSDNLVAGISVLLMFLIGLPFGASFIRESMVLERQLYCRGVHSIAQITSEYAAYLVYMLLLTVIPVAILTRCSVESIFSLLPVVVCICAIGQFLFSICKEMLSGTLLYILISVAVCFVSGCMYPIYFFPLSIQRFAAFLPAAAARRQIAAVITDTSATDTLLLLATAAVFFSLSLLIRYGRIHSERRALK